MCERDEEVHGFAENLVALVFRHELDGAHVVEPVGQLDEHDAHVVVEGDQDAAEVLGLEADPLVQRLVLVVVVERRLDLGQAVDQRGDLGPEEPFDVLHREFGVFHDVVEQGGADGLAAQPDLIDYDLGHGDGVQDVGLAGAASDPLVRFVGKFEGLEHQVVLLVVGTSFPTGDPQPLKFVFDQFIILFCKHSQSKFHWTASSAGRSDNPRSIASR